MSVPAHPRHQIEQSEQDEHGGYAPAGEASVDLARVDLRLRLVQRFAGILHDNQRNGPVHCSPLIACLCSRAARLTREDSSNAVNALEPSVQAQNMKKPML